ncbi:hypothetical protein FZ934_24500 (plasmid) [Rhizobium grahamii]|uniref:Uncharacterized protein n=1 Tax=Rhizobium grahamii TaxID=1120045 RepID=A0A5Q0CES1_9HYPH|nr:hypothetical protein FZ934_12545 [Rhizobium grahamii]QFY64104.1 hypothetical protein FZ934_24500 [Rhizobium grahamii]QRM51361.1 hypothetical protein F3Y33_10345 [Rhizobium sp. BG6]QRM53025.1 hypothetical protein F3Y33_21145 [Rhizobium sp. BG6]
MANAHHLCWVWNSYPFRLRSRGSKPVIRTNLSLPYQLFSGYLLQPPFSNDAIDVFDRITLLELRRAALLCPILRPASRD